jgi:hypothetical protein
VKALLFLNIIRTSLHSIIACPQQQNDVTRRGHSTEQDVKSDSARIAGCQDHEDQWRQSRASATPYSLYVQLSRCSRLDGIMLLSKVRQRDFVGNKVADSIVAAAERLDLLSGATIKDADPGTGQV